MAKTNKWENNTYWAVIKTSFNSSRTTWDEEKAWEFAYSITEGIDKMTFFPQDGIFETKERAQQKYYDVRQWAAYDRSRARSGYSAYKDRIWVHEVISKSGRNGVYLPTVGEIKKGMEYIANNLKSENFRHEWVDWAVKHEGMTPAQVREELIEAYMAD